MRKMLLSLCAFFFMAGVALAADVVLVKYNKDTKEVTVKEGDKESTYKLTDSTKYVYTTKDGDKEAKFENVEKLLSSEKAAGKAKMSITTDKGTITEIKLKGKGK